MFRYLNTILTLQVIFLALDVLVKNVVNSYLLEHKSIDDLFDSIFHCLGVLNKEDKDISKPFQELVFCIGTIHTTICQHMLKEEEQVHIFISCIFFSCNITVMFFKLRLVLKSLFTVICGNRFLVSLFLILRVLK